MQQDSDFAHRPEVSTGPLAPPTGAPAPRLAWRHAHPLAFGVLVGVGGVTAIAAVALASLAFFRQTPPLTRADYEAAAARWDARGPASYDLDLELGGRRPGVVHVEVRGGEVTHMTRDGVEPKQQRTWYYWSVPGQFDTIELELAMAQDPATSYGVPGAKEAVIWATFDPEYGYPLSFQRVVLGADLEVQWKCTRFTPISAKNAVPPVAARQPGQ